MKDTVYHVKETMWCPRHSNCQSCCIFTEGISGEARLELPAPPSGRATVAANSLQPHAPQACHIALRNPLGLSDP